MRPSRIEREEKICRLLRSGRFSVASLAQKFRCSEATIRRDLAGLRKAGKVMRIHGGAMANERLAYELSFKDKLNKMRAEKEAIATAAGRLVSPGAVVFLDTGTTTLTIARMLRAVEPAVIVTVNLGIALEYVGQKDVRVIIPGGVLSTHSPDVLGEMTLDALKDISVDMAFMGCDSANLADGFCTSDMSSAAVSRLMLSQSERSYLVADSSKFSHRSMCRIASLDKLTGVVTDSGITPEFQKSLEELGLDVIIGKV